MIKSLFALALIVTPVVAFAAPAPETFTAEGVTYAYTVEQSGKATVISGKDTSTGRPFTLRVAHGWVNGEMNGNPVSFSLNSVQKTTQTASLETQVVSR